jgi:SAM-dependent methyltransferase
MAEPRQFDAADHGVDYFSKSNRFRGLATKLALRAREKMFEDYRRVMPVDRGVRVIDIGVTPDRELADSNFFERLYPYKEQLTATSIEDASFLEQQYPGLAFVRTDGVRLPFADDEFDVAFSSAVLEHVGDRTNQRAFLAEMTRVARRFFMTTPNRNFPVELHTFLPFVHWLPQPMHQRVLRTLGKPFWAETDNLNLLRPKELVALFPPGTNVHVTSHRTLGLSSNLIAYGESPTRRS